jgi:hypothetical protein
MKREATVPARWVVDLLTDHNEMSGRHSKTLSIPTIARYRSKHENIAGPTWTKSWEIKPEGKVILHSRCISCGRDFAEEEGDEFLACSPRRPSQDRSPSRSVEGLVIAAI